MQARDFCFWLQGFFEMSGEDGPMALTPQQVAQMKTHLALVFQHDPSIPKHEMEHVQVPADKMLADVEKALGVPMVKPMTGPIPPVQSSREYLEILHRLRTQQTPQGIPPLMYC